MGGMVMGGPMLWGIPDIGGPMDAGGMDPCMVIGCCWWKSGCMDAPQPPVIGGPGMDGIIMLEPGGPIDVVGGIGGAPPMVPGMEGMLPGGPAPFIGGMLPGGMPPGMPPGEVPPIGEPGGMLAGGMLPMGMLGGGMPPPGMLGGGMPGMLGGGPMPDMLIGGMLPIGGPCMLPGGMPLPGGPCIGGMLAGCIGPDGGVNCPLVGGGILCAMLLGPCTVTERNGWGGSEKAGARTARSGGRS